MAGGRPGLQIEHAIADDLDGLGSDRGELAPEAVEVVAVESAGTSLEPARVDEVRRPDLAHMHPKSGIAAREDARCASMIEVDVRENEVAKILDRQASLGERVLERLQAGARTAVDQGRLLAGEQVRGDDPRAPEVQEV
jgi:hypothetical protein